MKGFLIDRQQFFASPDNNNAMLVDLYTSNQVIAWRPVDGCSHEEIFFIGLFLRGPDRGRGSETLKKFSDAIKEAGLVLLEDPLYYSNIRGIGAEGTYPGAIGYVKTSVLKPLLKRKGFRVYDPGKRKLTSC